MQNGQHFSCKKVFHLIVLFRFTLCKPHQKRPVAFQTPIITSCFYSLLFGFIKDELNCHMLLNCFALCLKIFWSICSHTPHTCVFSKTHWRWLCLCLFLVGVVPVRSSGQGWRRLWQNIKAVLRWQKLTLTITQTWLLNMGWDALHLMCHLNFEFCCFCIMQF